MEYTRIYHPQLNKFISTKSMLGKNLFKYYITQLQLGGVQKINNTFDVNHMPITTRLISPKDADLFNFNKKYKLYWDAGGNFEDKILSEDSYVSICPRGWTATCPSDDGWKLLKFPTSKDIQNNADLERIEGLSLTKNVEGREFAEHFKREEENVLLNVSDCLSRFYKNEGTAEFYVIGASVKKNLDFLTGKLVDKERDFTYTKPAKIKIKIENWDDYLKNFHALINNNSFVLNQNKAKIDAKVKQLKKSLKIVELEEKVKKFAKLANKLSRESIIGVATKDRTSRSLQTHQSTGSLHEPNDPVRSHKPYGLANV